MGKRTLKLGLVAATALSAALPLLAAQPAYADYAPSKGDVVGVGSDTLQYLIDFTADGDAYGDPGYNTAGNHNKLINFDATADANARLAYGVDGGQSAQTTCSPATGSGVGTANSGTTNTGVPCVLNPTIVLRAETQPVQRPNGSGGGFSAIEGDINGGTEEINFSRASSALGTSTATTFNLDSVEVATDTLPMLETTTPTSNAVPLSTTELNNIYNATTTTTNAYGGTGCVKWNQLPGNTAGSGDFIIPIIPQVGSGTRKFFLQKLQNTTGTPANPGNCAVVAEENDPTALSQQTSTVTEPMGEAGNPADAIEPISQGRLNLFLGVTNTGTSGGLPSGGYFIDPSCIYNVGSSTCGTGSVTAGTWVPNAVKPTVQPITTGSPGDGNALFNPSRPLYIYFRNSDITSTTGFQPGSPENWLNTLFYDPCPTGATNCQTIGGITYGQFGQPFIDTTAGQTDLEDAGVTPVNTDATGSFTADGP
jgi:hypothetical protein